MDSETENNNNVIQNLPHSFLKVPQDVPGEVLFDLGFKSCRFESLTVDVV